MATQLKTLRLDDEIINQINDMANSEFSGNFTSAVKSLLSQAVSMRSIDEDVRWKIYSGWKRVDDDHDDRLTRKIIDGLHI